MKELTIALISIILFIVFFPIILLLVPLTYFNQKKEDKELKKYLISLGDKNFFCYNNRSDIKGFIEKELIPSLNENIEIIYLEGREPKSNYLKDYISSILAKLHNYRRFPHLFKIRDGQIIDLSINNELFNTMNQNKPLADILSKMNQFFELKEKDKYVV